MSNNIYDTDKTESPFYDQERDRNFKVPKLTKAYENQDFLQSNDGRLIRIMSEYVEVESRLQHYQIKDTVVFYGSARFVSENQAREKLARAQELLKIQSDSADYKDQLAKAELLLKTSRYYEEARELAHRLTEWSLQLDEDSRFIVCSGGGPGIMEGANRGATEAHGPSIGMNISLPFEQEPNHYISEDLSFEFHYFFMRKFWFVFLAKALVVFPGGFGTFDELFDILTLQQTGKSKKQFSIVLYGKEFWENIVNWEQFVEWGVINKEDLDRFKLCDSVDDAFDYLTENFKRDIVNKKGYWHL